MMTRLAKRILVVSIDKQIRYNDDFMNAMMLLWKCIIAIDSTRHDRFIYDEAFQVSAFDPSHRQFDVLLFYMYSSRYYKNLVMRPDYCPLNINMCSEKVNSESDPLAKLIRC